MIVQYGRPSSLGYDANLVRSKGRVMTTRFDLQDPPLAISNSTDFSQTFELYFRDVHGNLRSHLGVWMKVATIGLRDWLQMTILALVDRCFTVSYPSDSERCSRVCQSLFSVAAELRPMALPKGPPDSTILAKITIREIHHRFETDSPHHSFDFPQLIGCQRLTARHTTIEVSTCRGLGSSTSVSLDWIGRSGERQDLASFINL